MQSWLLLAVVSLSLVPAAEASLHGSTPGSAVLYFHVADVANLGDIPMNTLAPPANFTYRAGGGPAAATFTCGAAAGAPGQESHTVYGIAYAAPTEDGVLPQALSGGARGLAYATDIGNVSLQWYLETSTQAGAPGADPDVLPVPVANVVVRVTVRQGEEQGGGALGYDGGLLIAQGQSDPALLAGPNTQGAGVDMVEGHYVYNFTVPLVLNRTLLGPEGFNVRVDVFADNPLCAASGGEAMAPVVRLHNSLGHRPALKLTVQEPLRALQTDVDESEAGVIHVRTSFLSVWGGYAVSNVTVAVQGPSAPRNATTVLLEPGAGGLAGPASPRYFFWNWNALAEGAVAGRYEVNITASDPSGNVLTARSAFILAEGEHLPDLAKPSPVPATLAFTVLLGLAVARRRRQV